MVDLGMVDLSGGFEDMLLLLCRGFVFWLLPFIGSSFWEEERFIGQELIEYEKEEHCSHFFLFPIIKDIKKIFLTFGKNFDMVWKRGINVNLNIDLIKGKL